MTGRPLIEVLYPDEASAVTVYDPNRLRAMIEERGMTLDDVAAGAGMKKQQVHELLSGRLKNPGIRTIERLVTAIGATMPELYGVDED